MSRHLRPHPDRIIEARRPAPPAPRDPLYLPGLLGVAVALLLICAFGNALARAFERPEACRNLTAAECAAFFQERTPK